MAALIKLLRVIGKNLLTVLCVIIEILNIEIDKERLP